MLSKNGASGVCRFVFFKRSRGAADRRRGAPAGAWVFHAERVVYKAHKQEDEGEDGGDQQATDDDVAKTPVEFRAGAGTIRLTEMAIDLHDEAPVLRIIETALALEEVAINATLSKALLGRVNLISAE